MTPDIGSGTYTMLYNNNVLFTGDSYTFNATNSFASTPAGLNNSTNMSLFRIVSAGLRAKDLTPILNRGGTVTFGMMPYYEITNANCIRDSLVDAGYSTTLSSADTKDFVGGVWLPSGPDAFNLRLYNASLLNQVVPFIYFAGVTASAVISIEYCINYEYIPAIGQTDLLPVDLGPVGTADGSLMKLSRALTLNSSQVNSAQIALKSKNPKSNLDRIFAFGSKYGPTLINGLSQISTMLAAA
jgi:hypothetical protein